MTQALLGAGRGRNRAGGPPEAAEGMTKGLAGRRSAATGMKSNPAASGAAHDMCLRARPRKALPRAGRRLGVRRGAGGREHASLPRGAARRCGHAAMESGWRAPGGPGAPPGDGVRVRRGTAAADRRRRPSTRFLRRLSPTGGSVRDHGVGRRY